ncbi:MAG: hypothetical protein AB7R69_00675 [Candidatus Babeliales bacterium]
MYKKLFSLASCAFLVSAISAQPDKEFDAIDIAIKLQKDCSESGDTVSWQALKQEVVLMARSCQQCTDMTIDRMAPDVCACLKRMIEILKQDPSISGGVTVTVYDSMSKGCQGFIRRPKQMDQDVESLEMMVHIERDTMNAPSTLLSRVWDDVVRGAMMVAKECQECTDGTMHQTVDKICMCIKDALDIIKLDPETKGGLRMVVHDSNHRGYQGYVARM